MWRNIFDSNGKAKDHLTAASNNIFGLEGWMGEGEKFVRTVMRVEGSESELCVALDDTHCFLKEVEVQNLYEYLGKWLAWRKEKEKQNE